MPRPTDEEIDHAMSVLMSSSEGRTAWIEVQRMFGRYDPAPAPDDAVWDDPAQRHPLSNDLIDWATFWDTDDDGGEDWVIAPLFARGRGHAVFAGAKTGKSWIVLAACAAVATGRTFLGFTNPAATVLYVDYEMTEADVLNRLTSFGYGPTDDLSRLHYALLPNVAPLDTPEGGQALLDAATALGVDLVVIDTTSRAVAGPENEADTYKAFYRHSGAVLKREGIAMVRLDHAGKVADRGMRGSSAKADDVDVVWQMTRTDSGQQWKATHRRMAWVAEAVTIDVTEDEYEATFSFGGHGPSWPAGTKECADDLDRLGIPVDISTRKAKAALIGADQGRRGTVVAAAVKWRKEHHFDPGHTQKRVLAGSNGTQSSDTNGTSKETAWEQRDTGSTVTPSLTVPPEGGHGVGDPSPPTDLDLEKDYL